MKVYLLTILAVLQVLTACKTLYVTKEVPVVVEHTTERNHTEWRVDTLYTHDSTMVYVSGDTLREVRYVERWRYRDRIVADTVRDTIPAIVETTKVELREVNVLRWWQKLLMWLGGVAGVVVFGWAVAKWARLKSPP